MSRRGGRALRVALLAAVASLLFAPSVLTPALHAQSADRTSPIPAGEAAPEITLGDQHGRPFALGEILKQRDFVVLAFYPKAFTSG